MKTLIICLLLSTGCAQLKTAPELYTERTHWHQAPRASASVGEVDCASLVNEAKEVGVDLSEDAVKRCSH